MTNPGHIDTAMIIDDELIDQKLFRRVMQRSGRVGEIIAFQQPEDALAILKLEDRPTVDVIFLDISMPRMSGFEFLEKAAEILGPDTVKTVVMLTTSSNPVDEERARTFDMVKAYLNKPLTVQDVVRVADGLVETA